MEASSRSANIQIIGILDKEKYKNKDVFFNLFFDYLFLYMFEISRIKNLRQLKMFEKIEKCHVTMVLKSAENVFPKIQH